MKKILIAIFILIAANTMAQKKVAITIDDVPNSVKFEKDGFKSVLLDKINTLNIPVAIFINESKIFQTKYTSKNFDLLVKWIKDENITLGNHSFSHLRYSDYNLEKYKEEILKGEMISKELAKQYKKSLSYFRFPYNDLGKDSLQQTLIRAYLADKGYKIAPFTIESSDWVFNYLYKYYIEKNDLEKAKYIGESYIENTIDLFAFYDSISIAQYGRNVNQIYLCHDSQLNADYLDILVDRLKKENYSFISMDEAMSDSIYTQKNTYYKKWGISWFYRWVSKSMRKSMMMKEPDFAKIYEEFDRVKQLKN